ncbi:MAG: hypothetical protein IKP72_15890 [Clostridia bacterium]|jgi:hypothetical protein|nr:hypothetical protein [Clostridia bacterium]
MKKLLAVLLAAMLVLTAASAFAEGEIKIGQVDYAAHGAGCFAVITAVVQDETIVAAKIDEFQFITDREDLAAIGVPNSDASFGESYPEGKVLGSKRVNNELYSLNMKQKAGSTVQIAANYDAIEAFATGKTIAELEAFVNGYTADTKAEVVDAVAGATAVDTWGYLQGILAAAKAALNPVGTYTVYNTTGENVTELYLINNLTGDKGVNYAAGGFAADAAMTITRTITAEEKEAGYSMTLTFKTEGGYEGSFATLHIEVAPIYLLSADGMTGATQISFRAPAAE